MKQKHSYSSLKAALAGLFGVILITLPICMLAQTNYTLLSDKNASIQVSGKSNVHDWKLNSSTMESHGDFKFDAQNNLTSISSFSFNVVAKSLKSGKGSMDSRTYTAMKADAYPNIIYKLANTVITKTEKNKYTVRSTGQLTIAGQSQTISIDLNVIVNADNSISCTGTENLKLTDYKIPPPSYMFGAMKVYNDLSIQFNLHYKKSNLLTVK